MSVKAKQRPLRKRVKGNGPIRKGEFNDDLTTATVCQRLWSAKLLAYMHDAVQPRKKGTNLNPKVAQGWFGTHDFRATCACAGVNDDDVLANLQHRLELARAGQIADALRGLVPKGREG